MVRAVAVAAVAAAVLAGAGVGAQLVPCTAAAPAQNFTLSPLNTLFGGQLRIVTNLAAGDFEIETRFDNSSAPNTLGISVWVSTNDQFLNNYLVPVLEAGFARLTVNETFASIPPTTGVPPSSTGQPAVDVASGSALGASALISAAAVAATAGVHPTACGVVAAAAALGGAVGPAAAQVPVVTCAKARIVLTLPAGESVPYRVNNGPQQCWTGIPVAPGCPIVVPTTGSTTGTTGSTGTTGTTGSTGSTGTTGTVSRTVGSTDVSGTAQSLSAGTLVASRFTLGAGETVESITSFSFYTEPPINNQQCVTGMYTDAAGSPGTRIATGSFATLFSAGIITSSSVSNGPAIGMVSPGANIWLAIACNAAVNLDVAGTGTSPSFGAPFTFSLTLPNTFPAGAAATAPTPAATALFNSRA